MSRPWSPKALAFLDAVYGTVPAKVVAETLQVTTGAVYDMARKRGLRARRAYYEWTPDRVDALRRMAGEGAGAHEAAAALGTSEAVVKGAAYRMGVVFEGRGATPRPYTPEEDEAVRRGVRDGTPVRETAAELGRTPKSVACRRQLLQQRGAVWDDRLAPLP